MKTATAVLGMIAAAMFLVGCAHQTTSGVPQAANRESLKPEPRSPARNEARETPPAEVQTVLQAVAEDVNTFVKGESADGKTPAEGDDADEETLQTDAKTVAAGLKVDGEKIIAEMKPDVYVVTIPRADLYVRVEDMEIPTAAGIYSEFRFFHCPCGKARVIGQFVVADYEANDVVSTLQEGHITVASMGPMLLFEKPRLMLIRFQTEGRAEKIAATLKSALSYTGDERTAPSQSLKETPDATPQQGEGEKEN